MADTIIKLPAELFALAESSHFEGSYDLAKLAIGPDDYVFRQPLEWSVDVTNTGSAFLVSGTVTGTGSCACSRCLEEVSRDFDGNVEGYFLYGVDSDDAGLDEDIGDDEFDVLPDDHMLDLAPLLCAALRVDAPEMPLCREDCAGLCPQCGANLNDGPCGCGDDDGLAAFDREANPFSVLAEFKFE